jgi:hypothetical protein
MSVACSQWVSYPRSTHKWMNAIIHECINTWINTPGSAYLAGLSNWLRVFSGEFQRHAAVPGHPEAHGECWRHEETRRVPQWLWPRWLRTRVLITAGFPRVITILHIHLYDIRRALFFGCQFGFCTRSWTLFYDMTTATCPVGKVFLQTLFTIRRTKWELTRCPCSCACLNSFCFNNQCLIFDIIRRHFSCCGALFCAWLLS